MHELLNSLMRAVIVLYVCVVVINLLKYLKNRKKYHMSAGEYLQTTRKYFFAQEKTTKKNRLKRLFGFAGWDISVEFFNILKYTLAVSVMFLLLMINATNVELEVETISRDVNYKRSMFDNPVVSDESTINLEVETLKKVDEHLKKVGTSITDPLALSVVQAYVAVNEINYDSKDSVATRIHAKLLKIEGLKNNLVLDVVVIACSLFFYVLPNILLALKLSLINSNKDWEILICLTIYSIIGRLPPYRIDLLINNIQENSKIYHSHFEIFKDVISRNDAEGATKLITQVKDDDIIQIFEILLLASEVGVVNTVDTIDDMIETKLQWLNINSVKNRQTKYMIAIIPVVIVLLLLYIYAIQGLNTLNSMTVG